MLDVRRLRVLREVAARGSITAAADALSYTPSAVSQQISALEREAGAVLLERRPRGVVLTEAGALVLGHAEVVFAELEAAETALLDLAQLRRGTLRMASFATASATIVPRAVDAFRARHGRIAVTVDQATSAAGVARLRRGRLDLALTADHDAVPDIDIVDLFEDPFRVALHRGHPFADAPELRLRDLAAETWIDVPFEAPGGELLTRACARAGFAPRVGYQSDDYTAIHEFVGAGLGLALLPDLALFPPNDDVVLRPLGPDGPSRRIQAATRAGPACTPAARAMLTVLRGLEPRRRPVRQPAAVTSIPSR